MSARKINLTQPIEFIPQSKMRLTLSADGVKIRKSGIEFRSATPIPAWTELSINLQCPDTKKVHCTGVVVKCDASPHSGYLVSLLFTGLSRQSLARLGPIASA